VRRQPVGGANFITQRNLPNTFHALFSDARKPDQLLFQRTAT